ncbi:hypothetical protein, partial [Klebsiella aerogenes]|uniref:hypothetical protein n=1 Tax=Klebsiella aerogenes TaxID=548 RepID=UPI0019531C83
LSLGICVGALALSGSMLLRSHATPELGDFSAAFLVVTAISLTATIWNLRFSQSAGADISGHTKIGQGSRRMKLCGGSPCKT